MADLGPWESESHFMQAGANGYVGMQHRSAIAVDQLADRASLTSCIRRGALKQPNVK